MINIFIAKSISIFSEPSEQLWILFIHTTVYSDPGEMPRIKEQEIEDIGRRRKQMSNKTIQSFDYSFPLY